MNFFAAYLFLAVAVMNFTIAVVDVIAGRPAVWPTLFTLIGLLMIREAWIQAKRSLPPRRDPE